MQFATDSSVSLNLWIKTESNNENLKSKYK